MSTFDSSLYQAGFLVWVENPYPEDDDAHYRDALPHSARPMYVPAVVDRATEGNVSVKTLWPPVQLLRTTIDKLLPRNKDSNVDDLSVLPFLHTPAIVDTIQTRFSKDIVYTFAGPILLALNPYKPLQHGSSGRSLYDGQTMEKYRKRVPQKVLDSLPTTRREKMKLPPHLFCVADDSFKALQETKQQQAIVISGESGAGKTETTKYILQYLTTVSSTMHSSAPKNANKAVQKGKRGSLGSAANPFESKGTALIEKEILEANPIMEAFGNAKTIRNDNSSRFGKFIKIYFDEQGIAGGSISNYLLEKIRVVQQQEGERNYHSFYQLLDGTADEEKKKYLLTTAGDYSYVKRSAHITVNGIDDAKEFAHFKQAMETMGIDEDTQEQLFCVVAAILHLGNVKITTNADDMAAVDNAGLQPVGKLLGVDAGRIGQNLVVKTMVITGQQSQDIPVKANEAADVRDALAKTLYGNLFQWIMHRINQSLRETAGQRLEAATQAEKARSRGTATEALYIGVLDIFGFEVFDMNSFEQLCINFANEKMQQFFTSHIFKKEIELYSSENIDYSEVKFEDNQEIIDLIEKRPLGVLPLLDESCLFPRSTDESLLEKLHSSHARNSKRYSKPHANKANAFVIKHFAADVEYCVKNFLDKNRDRLPENIESVIKSSSNLLVQEMFSDAIVAASEEQAPSAKSQSRRGSSRGGMAGANAFLGSKFKEDIKCLVATLNSCQPFFIRCIKPNAFKEAGHFDPKTVSHQLLYLGVLDSIEIRNSGFSDRRTYEEFFDRFVIIVPAASAPKEPSDDQRATTDWKKLCQELVKKIWSIQSIEEKFGQDQSNYIQLGRTRAFMRKTLVQSLETLREFKLQDMDKAAVLLQSVWRMHIGKLGWSSFKDGVTRFQAAVRAHSDRQEYNYYRGAITTIQNRAHTWITCRWFNEARQATQLVQAFFRKNTTRLKWLRLRRGLKMVHSLARGFIVRKHVLKMLDAVLVIQDTSRDFLEKNRVYWNKVHLALRLQSWARGWRCRDDMEETMLHLERKRMIRQRHRSVRTVQAVWRSLLVNRRFKEVNGAARVLQHWTMARSERNTFLLQKWAAQRLQSAARGMSSRIRVAEMLGQNMVSDEQWRLKIIREREAIQLKKMNMFKNKSKDRTEAPFLVSVIDVDMIVDSSDIYSNGWAVLVAELEEKLEQKRKTVKAYTIGATHTAVLTDGGEVYSWGWGDHGQLGHGCHSNEPSPRLVEHLLLPSWGSAAGLRVKQLDCGQDHTVVVAENGKVFSWGANRRGQLGHSNFKSTATPRAIETFHRRVAAVAAGAHHSIALMEGGLVFSWGSGPQLGHGVFTGKGDISTPAVVKELSKRRIKFVRCGWAFVVCLSHNGDMFSWGENGQGQLGLGDCNSRVTPVQVKPLRVPQKQGRGDKFVKAIALSCGGRHVLAVSSICRVFTWGWNKHGQLGLGDVHDRNEPSLVLGKLHNSRVKEASCGWRHTMVLTDSHQLFAWGQAGCIRQQDRSVLNRDSDIDETHFESHQPQEVYLPAVQGKSPYKLHCAWSHTSAITNVTFNQTSRITENFKQKRASGAQSSLPAEYFDGNDEDAMKDRSSKRGVRPVGASTPPEVSITPAQLQDMSAEELRNLVAQLQGVGGNGIGVGAISPSPADVKGSGASRQGNSDRWNPSPKTESTGSLSSSVRSQLTQFSTTRTVSPNKTFTRFQQQSKLEMTQREKDRKEQEQKQREAEQLLEQARREAEMAKRQRREIEGQVGDMSYLFSSAHLVASSAKLRGESISAKEIEQKYSRHGLEVESYTPSNKVESFRQQQEISSKMRSDQVTLMQKPNRRASATMRVRRQIERDIYGEQMGNGPHGQNLGDGDSFVHQFVGQTPSASDQSFSGARRSRAASSLQQQYDAKSQSFAELENEVELMRRALGMEDSRQAEL